MVDHGSRAVKIVLSDEDREVLAQWARGASRRAARARIVLACAEEDPKSVGVAKALGLPRLTSAA